MDRAGIAEDAWGIPASWIGSEDLDEALVVGLHLLEHKVLSELPVAVGSPATGVNDCRREEVKSVESHLDQFKDLRIRESFRIINVAVEDVEGRCAVLPFVSQTYPRYRAEVSVASTESV